MINDMKLGIRLLRYGFGIKTNLVLLIVFTAADLLCFALELAGITMPLDGFMLLACAMIPGQILFTLNAVDIVLASPARKKLQTSVPAVMSLCTTLAAYLIVVLKEAVIVLIHPDKTAQSAMHLFYRSYVLIIYGTSCDVFFSVRLQFVFHDADLAVGFSGGRYGGVGAGRTDRGCPDPGGRCFGVCALCSILQKACFKKGAGRKIEQGAVK